MALILVVFYIAVRNKCGRKEPWDRLRRRGLSRPFARDVDVWVRRESVHTQTADNSPVLPPTPDDDEDDSGGYLPIHVAALDGSFSHLSITSLISLKIAPLAAAFSGWISQHGLPFCCEKLQCTFL